MAVQAKKFGEFEFYKKNLEALRSDLKYIEQIDQNQHSLSSEKVLIGMRELVKNHDVLTGHQSISKLTAKVHEMGWKNVEKKTLNIAANCEAAEFSLASCVNEIDKLMSFVSASNLRSEHKLELNRELDFYKTQQVHLARFQSDFSSEFNKNINIVNSAQKTLLSAKGPLQTSSTVKEFRVPLINSQYVFFSSAILLILVSAFFYWGKRKKETLEHNFFGAFLYIQKPSGLKVRLFGDLSAPSILKMKKFSSRLQEIFSRKRTYFGEMHFKFKETDKVIKLETCYLSKDPLQFYYEETSGEISSKLKQLIAEIEEAQGEVTFSTRINGEGNVISSSMSIYLPA